MVPCLRLARRVLTYLPRLDADFERYLRRTIHTKLRLDPKDTMFASAYGVTVKV